MSLSSLHHQYIAHKSSFIINMQLDKTLLAILATGALAAPRARSSSGSKSMMASSQPEWTIESLKRVCSTDGTTCTWNFGIDTHAANTKPTNCTYIVHGSPADHANGGPASCGIFNITSGWSNQFGNAPQQTFTVLSVVDYPANLIVYPGYTDQQLNAGQVVKPDQSYQPQGLPT